MSQLGTVYATKRRRRNGKSLKAPPKEGMTKSNPSKRHRERLNAELDLLASLLPFEQNILSKLDRLSILRLSVSYLRTKSYFQVVMHKSKDENGIGNSVHPHDSYRTREIGSFETGPLDGEMFLQALNGFIIILTCEGEVFFATHTIESYLGFHQSDIVHQSVYELVHSEDREELQRQLLWNTFLPADLSGLQLTDALVPEKSTLLERSFTVRFRCLLDNTSGFLRLDIRGRVKILHGQNRKVEEPPLALFAFCTPFGPPSLLEIPPKENMFKSKHKLDFTLVSMDQKGKITLGYSDSELANMGGYDLVHFDDLAYVASAHQELLKTGASGMIAYRYHKKNGDWQWLQTSSRLVYKNSKPDFIICTHRQLMEEEGRDLLGKRTMDFKVSYLDTGLTSTYFTDADQLIVTPSGSPTTATTSPASSQQRYSRRYKTQLRDFLSTCRSKRKLQQSPGGQVASPVQMVEYVNDPAVAVAAAYSNLNPMYTTSPYVSTESMYMTPPAHSSNFYSVSDNIFHQYRLQGVSGYFPEYASTPASYITNNGFVPYESYGIAKDERWQETEKCMPENDTINRDMDNEYESSDIHKKHKQSPSLEDIPSSTKQVSTVSLTNSNNVISSNVIKNPNTIKNRETNDMPYSDLKEEALSPQHFEPRRQTVLMWGTSQATKHKFNCSAYNDNSCSTNTSRTTTNCSSSQSPASNDRNVVNSNEETHLNLERNETGKDLGKNDDVLVLTSRIQSTERIDNTPTNDKLSNSPLLSLSDVTNTLLEQ